MSSADHAAGRRYIASAGVRWCGAGGVRKDVYLGDTHTKLGENNDTRRAWAQLCIARLAWPVSLKILHCPARPFSFLPFYLTRFLAFRTPPFRHPRCPLHPPTGHSTHQGRPPASEGNYGSGRESRPLLARSRTDARSFTFSTKFECTFALSMMQPWEKAVICKPLTIAAHNASTHNPSTPQGLP